MPRNEREGNDKRTSASGNKFSFCAITLTLINTPTSLKKVTSGRRGYSGHFIIMTGTYCACAPALALGRNVFGHISRL